MIWPDLTGSLWSYTHFKILLFSIIEWLYPKLPIKSLLEANPKIVLQNCLRGYRNPPGSVLTIQQTFHWHFLIYWYRCSPIEGLHIGALSFPSTMKRLRSRDWKRPSQDNWWSDSPQNHSRYWIPWSSPCYEIIIFYFFSVQEIVQNIWIRSLFHVDVQWKTFICLKTFKWIKRTITFLPQLYSLS